ncbi:MAG TPA: BON domain-containing protein [Sunxiuqinia sp.]|nr:BON domain-containing protein [Sunxiuqinia sp.]
MKTLRYELRWTKFEKMQAENATSKTISVMDVENNLKVNNENDQYFTRYYGWNSFFPPAQIKSNDHYQTDKEIKNQIESQLWWSPYVNKDEVNVSVSNVVATLKGTNETKREKLMAQINAIEGGAKDVNNNLIVKYKP